MVKTLHRAGIEVILDVVYNHTAEGNHLGPTLSLRGIDNKAFYRLSPEDPRYYMDFSGTGNSLNMLHPRAIQLIMDSLRLLGARDARRRLPLRPRARPRPRALRGEPARDVLRHHPAGPGALAGEADRRAVGRRARRLPGRATSRSGWAEWNGKYRDCVRRFWRGDPGQLSELAFRLVRLQRPVRGERPEHLRLGQLRDRPRRLHAAGPRDVRGEAQRAQRRGQQGRDRRELLARTGGSRARATSRRSSRSASG